MSDNNVHGKHHTVVHSQVELSKSVGRALAILPRDWPGAANGFLDLDQDDAEKGTWMDKAQEDALKPVDWIVAHVSADAQ